MKRTTLFFLTHLSMINCAFYLVISVWLPSLLLSSLSSLNLNLRPVDRPLYAEGRTVFWKRIDNILTLFIFFINSPI